jgi:hypothetical protein
VVGHLRDFEFATVSQILRDAGRAEAVTPDFRPDAGGEAADTEVIDWRIRLSRLRRLLRNCDEVSGTSSVSAGSRTVTPMVAIIGLVVCQEEEFPFL